ncbi:MAG: hypothetical protein BWY43_00425 [candidate division WS2 bacterium ADurb.Bin280]|uniref:Type 4 fimbrial biogenesis protein PilX N-terminal domain-containing protein n=1 Tax=candidate division WS2 bacterium ADurb.Bin280 TaxID=1852829 RepID=A0A1V5SDN4_9BACT|nr:MAG: hypothetical protein BWY43_00425 [candidate division WS2 bacterium ADurb.Bin280]
MKIKTNKIKSSAIIMALIVGIIITIIATSAALIVSSRLQITAQSRQGKQAYRAAVSGIEDALMLIKQARLTGNLSSVTDFSKNKVEIAKETPDRRRATYDLQISSDLVSSFPSSFQALSSADLYSKLTQLNYSNAASSSGFGEKIEEFSKINIDNYYDIDITHADVSSMNIYFSKPHYRGTAGKPKYLNNSITALNLKLISEDKNGEGQLVYEETTDKYDNKAEVLSAKINLCKRSGATCKLRIRPQATSASNINPKYSGIGASTPGKYIYFAVVSRNSIGGLVGYEEENPGIVKIQSIGYVGEAVRKLEAKVDLTSGQYLGLFDFGVYCGEKCEGRGIDAL